MEFDYSRPKVNPAFRSVFDLKQVLQDFESARSIPQAISEDNLKQRVSAPDWIDLNLARRGQKFARGNILAISISHSYGLTTMPHPDLVNVLLFTGRSSSPESAAKRYYSTTTEILSCKISREGINLNSRDYSAYTPIAAWPSFHKDLEESNIPLCQRRIPPTFGESKDFIPFNQHALALTQFSFVGYPILFPERFGIFRPSEDDLWAFNHFWAILGYTLGLEDKYNIALQPDLKSVREVYLEIFERYTIAAGFHWWPGAVCLVDSIFQ
ncbi:hypothetical protein Fcan01_23990, partial [Folsomia candida]